MLFHPRRALVFPGVGHPEQWDIREATYQRLSPTRLTAGGIAQGTRLARHCLIRPESRGTLSLPVTSPAPVCQNTEGTRWPPGFRTTGRKRIVVNHQYRLPLISVGGLRLR